MKEPRSCGAEFKECFGWTSQGEGSTIVRACFEKSIEFQKGRKKRAWATEYEVEKTSGRTYRSDWTEKARYH